MYPLVTSRAQVKRRFAFFILDTRARKVTIANNRGETHDTRRADHSGAGIRHLYV